MGGRIWAALLCGLLLCAPALAIGPVSGEQMRGMDVSVYQGNVDFAAAKADGIETVYIRAGYGETGVDAYYRQHYEGASAAGLKVAFITIWTPLPRRGPDGRPRTLPPSSGIFRRTAVR